ncbi:hypothetical protein [Rhizobium sp. AAP43]|uniref:hypothetical protein n=1 Tax=Rhizobium sp. AAP43 TaxID=1523420 RepID=UPI0006B9A8C4|nr:hypothetical protein [Rhizobium sp. AAP43]KPF47054.1 hypothetical protein IP76_01760 [Rhizobium sp. AAP43]
MRAILFWLVPSLALAGLPPEIPEDQPERTRIVAAAVPCLRGETERRYVVHWWVVNERTGERMQVGSRQVRLRC